MEEWGVIPEFPSYSVSMLGNVRRDASGRILTLLENRDGVVVVGLMGPARTQYKRSVALLVAKQFVPKPNGRFDTPICLDGDRYNNSVSNLMWRPRWFAVKYNKQMAYRFHSPIPYPIRDRETGELYENSLDVSVRNGLLESDVVLSILNRTYVWPTYQLFEMAD